MLGKVSGTGMEVPAKTILQDHEEIKSLLNDVREFLGKPRPALEARGYHRWASRLSRHLVKLHDRMFQHFRFEERTGILEELLLAHPNASRRIESLVVDHEEILAEVRRLTAASMKYGENKPPEDVHLRKRMMDILDRLEQHEKAETELIQRLVHRELGMGD